MRLVGAGSSSKGRLQLLWVLQASLGSLLQHLAVLGSPRQLQQQAVLGSSQRQQQRAVLSCQWSQWLQQQAVLGSSSLGLQRELGLVHLLGGVRVKLAAALLLAQRAPAVFRQRQQVLEGCSGGCCLCARPLQMCWILRQSLTRTRWTSLLVSRGVFGLCCWVVGL